MARSCRSTRCSRHPTASTGAASVRTARAAASSRRRRWISLAAHLDDLASQPHTFGEFVPERAGFGAHLQGFQPRQSGMSNRSITVAMLRRIERRIRMQRALDAIPLIVQFGLVPYLIAVVMPGW